MYQSARIAVVIPAFNEGAHLAGVLEGIPHWVDRVVVVDDGSWDTTADIAIAWKDPVRLIRHEVNQGVGAAIATGYEAALRDGADAIAVMAGDGQMRPDELAKLVDPVVNDVADYCKGDRLAHPRVGELMPRWRRWGTQMLSRGTCWLSGYRGIRDAQCGFTVISRRVLQELALMDLVKRYGYPNDLLVILGQMGARLLEVPVTPVYGDESSGITPHGAVFSHGGVLLRAWARLALSRTKPRSGLMSAPRPSERQV